MAHVEGPLLILAGAGSGKTRVITNRICHLMTAHDVPGSSILAVTFTNKAAGEMRDRVMKMLGGVRSYQDAPVLATFHSFCVRLLRRDGDRLGDVRRGFTRQFTIYDDDDQLALIKQSYRHLSLDEKFMAYRAALSAISHAKNHGETPDDWRKKADPKSQRLAAIFERYTESLIQNNAVDFDDLLLLAVKLLAHDEMTRLKYNRQFGFLMIDEYQDTNRAQYDLVRLLTREHQNLAVVGDEDQSIYGWRGADIRNILDFERDYPRAKVIRLEQNYRSTKNILAAASAVVARNTQRKGKTLWTASDAGPRLSLFEAGDGEQEAMFIASTIERTFDREPGTKVAVLYRTNFQSRQIEEALRRIGRKYTVVGGISFYGRAEVKDALAYLKLLSSPDDSIALLRIINTPARGIGKTTVEQIELYALNHGLSLWAAIQQMIEERAFAARAESALQAFVKVIRETQSSLGKLGLNDLLRELLDQTGYFRMLREDQAPDAETRLGNLEELINAAADAQERGESITGFLDHAALVAQADQLDEKASITLMTMHNAKGLEFPVVFVAGCEEGLFPHSRSRDNEEFLEEERRLCYVALTRAEKRLYLSHARFRRRFGGGMPEATIPSRFLTEIPAELIERQKSGVFRDDPVPQVNLFAEQSYVRESAKRTTYTGKTYNSQENIAQFFRERGIPYRGSNPAPPAPAAAASAPAPAVAPPPRFVPSAPPPKTGTAPAGGSNRPKRGLRSGAKVSHPKYGRGTVLRIEGDGDDAKLTISFAAAGMKKLVAKYAGISIEE